MKKNFWKVNCDDIRDFWKEKPLENYYDWWNIRKYGDIIYINHIDLGLKDGKGEYGFKAFNLLSYNLYIENEYEYMGEFIPNKKLRKLKLKNINEIPEDK